MQDLSFEMQKFYLNLSAGQKARLLRWRIPFLLPRLRECFSSARFLYIGAGEGEGSPSQTKVFSHRLPYFFIGTRVCFPVRGGESLLGFVLVSMVLNFRQVEQIRESIDACLGQGESQRQGRAGFF